MIGLSYGLEVRQITRLSESYFLMDEYHGVRRTPGLGFLRTGLNMKVRTRLVQSLSLKSKLSRTA